MRTHAAHAQIFPAPSMNERAEAASASLLPQKPFRTARVTDLADHFVITTLTDRAYATTRSPLELCVRASIGGVPAIVFQTVLPPLLGKEPGQQGAYRYRFQLPEPGIPFSLIHSVSISNRTDDAWGVLSSELYAWGVNSHGEPEGGLLARGPRVQVVSQDATARFPEPAPELHVQSGWNFNAPTDTYVLHTAKPTSRPS
jgi:hypothetical protein